ncbi:MAG: desulfoferrodoxin [Candidatus Bathyarchaeota archaeon]|nr:MAG: desulfoferrodoxin [Candidatus Bathyarchaeota archaeon]
MTERNQTWKCEICGNIVEVLHSGQGQLVCCGQPMKLLEDKKLEEGTEKHLPVVEVEGDTVTVRIGSEEHPMVEKHYIEWITAYTGAGILRKFLNPGEKPVATFCTKDKVLQARCYCNIHGQWATEI